MVNEKVDNFIEVLLASRLVNSDQVDRALSALQKENDGMPVTNVAQICVYLVDNGLLTEWQADKLKEGRHKGFFLGKYKLLDHLGTGGMSSVYLAEHLLMQRRVAIKILPKSRVEDTSYLARFHREAQAAAALDDPNIVRAYDVDNDGGLHYLVMEHVAGANLQQLAKDQGPLAYQLAADYIRQAALGLAHAHQIGLIHRDVKPANLLVNKHNVVKVLDLGLARFSDDDVASLTIAYDENVLGTADYLAPEQAINSHGVDARADIYSLGCSLYYLLTGHAPFPEGTLPQRIMMHQKEEPADIKSERPDAPTDLVKICAKMMAKKANHRFQSAQAVADILAKWLIVHGYEETLEATGGSSKRLKLAAEVAKAKAKAQSRAHAASAPVAASPANQSSYGSQRGTAVRPGAGSSGGGTPRQTTQRKTQREYDSPSRAGGSSAAGSSAPGGRSAAPSGRSAAPVGRSAAPGGRSAAPGGRSSVPGSRSSAPGSRAGGQSSAPGSVRGIDDTMTQQYASTMKGKSLRGDRSAQLPAEAANLQQLRDPLEASIEDDRLPEFMSAPLPEISRPVARQQKKEDGLPVWVWALLGAIGVLAFIVILAMLFGG